MGVGGLQGRDIAGADVAGATQALSPPGEALAAEAANQKVGRQPRVAAIAVDERMDEHQPMMEAHGQLVGRVDLMIAPVSGVINELAKLHGDQVRRGADVSLRVAKPARPGPDLAKHSPV